MSLTFHLRIIWRSIEKLLKYGVISLSFHIFFVHLHQKKIFLVMDYKEFSRWLSDLDSSTIDSNPITFYLDDFDGINDFGKSMFLCGSHFRDSDDIVVRYSKPYSKDKLTVNVCFQILRSKAKMFKNYIGLHDIKISCILTSNKEIKEAIKFLNSLGVKGEDGIALLSKESDYASMIRDDLNRYADSADGIDAVKVTISMVYDDENESHYPMLSYDFVKSSGWSNFEDTKKWINTVILKRE